SVFIVTLSPVTRVTVVGSSSSGSPATSNVFVGLTGSAAASVAPIPAGAVAANSPATSAAEAPNATARGVFFLVRLRKRAAVNLYAVICTSTWSGATWVGRPRAPAADGQ